MDETALKTARRLWRRAEDHRCLQCGRKIRIEKHHVAGVLHISRQKAGQFLCSLDLLAERRDSTPALIPIDLP